MPPKKLVARKVAAAIPKAGTKSVDPLKDTKAALKANSSSVKAEPVDDSVPRRENYSVVVDPASGRPLSVYLMWSDLKDNHNKYYVLQVLKTLGGTYYVWTRFGRVGAPGVTNFANMGDEASAIKEFHKIERAKKNKGYNEIKMSLGSSKNPEVEAEDESKKGPIEDSKLDKSLQSFVELIFNKKLMESSVSAAGYDIKKMPLGELSKDQALKGVKILKQLEEVILGKAKGDILQLTSEFYTMIPHNFGMQKMINFKIDTVDKVRDKMYLVNNLINIQDTYEMLKSGKKDKVNPKPQAKRPNPIDENFAKLAIKMQTIKAQEAEYKFIEEYVQKGRGHQKLKIVDCFRVERPGEIRDFNPKKLDNKKLLWHGSRFSNFVGILTQGLRIAPPEAPSTGYNFGKGVYFADMIEKSWWYAHPGLSGNVGIFVLAEVALGNPLKLQSSRTNTNASNLPAGCHSTQAMGSHEPDPCGNKTILGDVTIPLGKIVDTKNTWYTNEFIVYNTNQIRIRYIVRLTDR